MLTRAEYESQIRSPASRIRRMISRTDQRGNRLHTEEPKEKTKEEKKKEKEISGGIGRTVNSPAPTLKTCYDGRGKEMEKHGVK